VSPDDVDAPAPSGTKDVMTVSEEQQEARRALQESMDLREQGHTDE
jgi:hypothetical protein